MVPLETSGFGAPGMPAASAPYGVKLLMPAALYAIVAG